MVLCAAVRPSYFTLSKNSKVISVARRKKEPLTAEPRPVSPFESLLSELSNLFGVVSIRTHQQAITRLSSLSYSRSETFSEPRMRLTHPAACLSTAQVPDAGSC